MLEPIKKMPRISEDGAGNYYIIETGARVETPPTPSDDADKVDEIIDRVNLLSAIIKTAPPEILGPLPGFLIVRPGEEAAARRLLEANRKKNKRKEKL